MGGGGELKEDLGITMDIALMIITKSFFDSQKSNSI